MIEIASKRGFIGPDAAVGQENYMIDLIKSPNPFGSFGSLSGQPQGPASRTSAVTSSANRSMLLRNFSASSAAPRS